MFASAGGLGATCALLSQKEHEVVVLREQAILALEAEVPLKFCSAETSTPALAPT